MRLDQKLLLENKAWAQQKTTGDESYFVRLAKGQSPSVLWIGCSDSRVPAEDITNSSPGEVFVHRNIANQMFLDDPNASSVVEFAVSVLKVKHIMICGHYECGGMRASLGTDALSGNLAIWLAKIRETCKDDLVSLRKMDDTFHAANLLSERNVLHQVARLKQIACVQQAMAERGLLVHGWVFDMNSGLLKDLTPSK